MAKPKHHKVRMFTYGSLLNRSGVGFTVYDLRGRNRGRVEINYAGIDIFKPSGKKPLHRWYWKDLFVPLAKK